MNKHFRKIAMLMALMISMSAFAACGQDDGSSVTSSAPESSAVESSEESSESSVVEDASSVVAPDAEESSEESAASSELEELVNSLYEGIPEDEMPAVMSTPITEENAESVAFVPASDFAEGIASDAMINAVAHSVVLLRANSADEAASLAEKVEENADPRKWVCVEAEKVIVKTHGEYVLLVMSSASTADKIAENFDAAFAE